MEEKNVNIENIENEVSFDLTIVTNNNSYKANIVVKLNLDKLITNGVVSYEKNDCSDIVFKRI